MDRHFYGDWVFPPLKFIYFNVVQSLAVFYGKNRTDYYFTEGLPLLLTTALPFASIGMWRALRSNSDNSRTATIQSTLASAVTTSVVALTLISHKEVRFLFPLLPLLHILAAKPLVTFFELDSKHLKQSKLALLALAILINVGIATYTGHFHQRGVLQVTHYLRHEYEAHHLSPDAESKMTVAFLMPCHSTPWRSHLVYPDISAWALTCEPPLHLGPEQRQGYLDEADVFYANPSAWIESNMRSLGVRKDGSVIGGLATGMKERREWPQYLGFFEQLTPLLEEKLEGSGYVECWREFNTHWHDDWRRKGDVVVWCMR
jgi:phosphatidylinositol glycan class B